MRGVNFFTGFALTYIIFTMLRPFYIVTSAIFSTISPVIDYTASIPYELFKLIAATLGGIISTILISILKDRFPNWYKYHRHQKTSRR